MMEVTPHLKNVLKNYQHSATKSLQGPGLLAKNEPPEEEEFIPPISFPVQQVPILTTPDTTCSERSETVLEGESISCFVVGGERRLCLPQVLNSVLRDFTLPQINHECDQLQIYCSRCTPEQLNVLKQGGVLPSAAASSGLITKTDAERLCSALLHSQVSGGGGGGVRGVRKGAVSFAVYHKCFGKCSGLCFPELYTSKTAKCIECSECRSGFSPQQFVCHVHKHFAENRTVHWGFDSMNWRQYLKVAKDQPDQEQCFKYLDEIKEQFDGNIPFPSIYVGIKRKQVLAAEILKDHELPRKKQKLLGEYLHHHPLESSYNLYATLDAMYLNRCIQDFQAVNRHMSAFKPINNHHHKDAKVYTGIAAAAAVVTNNRSDVPPVLQNPERVVPLADSERFETTFQPNVALAPSTPKKLRYGSVVTNGTKEELVNAHNITNNNNNNEESVVVVKKEQAVTAAANVVSVLQRTNRYNSEIELSTDTEDSASEVSEKSSDLGRIEELIKGFDENIRENILGSFKKLLEENEKLIKECQIKDEKIKELQQTNCKEEEEEENKAQSVTLTE